MTIKYTGLADSGQVGLLHDHIQGFLLIFNQALELDLKWAPSLWYGWGPRWFISSSVERIIE